MEKAAQRALEYQQRGLRVCLIDEAVKDLERLKESFIELRMIGAAWTVHELRNKVAAELLKERAKL